MRYEDENIWLTQKMIATLYDYNSVEEMIAQCTHEIQNNIIDIFVMWDGTNLVGELHVMYQADDSNFAVPGRRAYLPFIWV